MQSVQDRQVAGQQLRLGGAERTAIGVCDEYPWRGDMAPAEMTGANAEIVLLAIALGEDILAEQPDLRQAVAAKVDAEAMCCRHLNDRAAIGPASQTIEPERCRCVRNRIGTIFPRITEHRCIVGKWCRGPDVRCAVRRLGQSLDPARRRQRIAVQQNHVAVAGGSNAGIGSGGKAAILRLVAQQDAALPRQFSQRFHQSGFGRCIFDHNTARACRQRGQHTVDAGKGSIAATIGRDHDVDAHRTGSAPGDRSYTDDVGRHRGQAQIDDTGNPARGGREQSPRQFRSAGRTALLQQRIQRTAVDVPASFILHRDRRSQRAEVPRRDAQAARAGERPGMAYLGRRIAEGDTQRGASGILNGQQRRTVRITWEPRPAGQAAGGGSDEALDLADRRGIQRTAQQVATLQADGDLRGVSPSAWQQKKCPQSLVVACASPRSHTQRHSVEQDHRPVHIGRPIEESDTQPAVGRQSAPAGVAMRQRDHVM